MALDYWKLNGLTSSFNPLTTSFSNGVNKINDLPIGSWTVNFYAYSPTNQPIGLKLDSISNTYVVDQPLTTNRKFYTFTFNNPADQTFYIKGFSPSSTDIVIDSIQVVKTPLPKLTINGVDGFLSGKWSLNTTSTAQDDQTLIINPTGTWQTSWLNNLSVIPNQTYTFSNIGGTGNAYIYYPNGSGTLLATITVGNSGTFTVPSGQNTISIGLSNGTNATSQVTFKQPMLNLGSVPAPYSPKTGDRMVMPFAKNNLLPPLSKVSNQLLNNAVITGDHSLSLSVSDAPSYHSSYFSIPVVSGKTYTVSGVTNDPNACIRVHAGIGFSGALLGGTINSNSSSYFSFTADDSFNGYASVRLDNNGANGTFNFNSLQVVEGTVPFGIAQENKLPQKYVTKKNLFDGVYNVGQAVDSTNHVISQTNAITTDYIAVQPNTTYTISKNFIWEDRSWIGSFDSSKTSISTNDLIAGVVGWTTNTFTTPSNCYYIKYYFWNGSGGDKSSLLSNIQIQLEQGSTATPYEPYQLVLPPANKGLSFNGVTDYITIPYGLGVNMTGYTINCDLIVNKIPSNGGVFFGAGYDSTNNNKRFYVGISQGVNSISLGIDAVSWGSSGFTVNEGQEINIQITCSNGNANLFINGTFVQSRSYNGFGLMDNFTIGRYLSGYYSPITIKNFNIIDNNSVVKVNYDFTNPNNIVGNTVFQNAQNLIPSFEDAGWTINSNAKVMGKDTLHLDATGTGQWSRIYLPVVPNTNYTFTCNHNSMIGVYIDGSNAIVGGGYTSNKTINFNSGSNSALYFYFSNSSSGSFDFIRPQLYLLDGTQGTINGSPVQLNKPSKRSLYAKR